MFTRPQSGVDKHMEGGEGERNGVKVFIAMQDRKKRSHHKILRSAGVLCPHCVYVKLMNI